MFLDCLTALRSGVSEQVADNAIVAIQRGVEAIEGLLPILLLYRQLLLRRKKAQVIHFGYAPRVIPDIPGSQNQHAGVPEPIREEYGRYHDNDDADSHS